MNRTPLTLAGSAGLALLLLARAPVVHACELAPLDQLLLSPELRSDTPQYAEFDYRKQLLRFVHAYYSELAEDLLRGEGTYLLSLHRLMGSDGADCTPLYRDLLLQGGSSQDFAVALWTLRTAPASETASTFAAGPASSEGLQ